jgi:methionyl-tRNA formyltransferase
MDILWLSANQLGYELLKTALNLDGIKVKAVITLAPDAETKMYDGISYSKWEKFGIDLHLIKQINEEKALIQKIAPQLIVVCGWRQIIGKDILEIPPKGVIGFHPTLLPYGRGPAPIINTILSGLKESGVTMYYFSAGLDEGDIIGQERFAIARNDHAGEVYKKVIRAGKRLVQKHIPLIAAEKAARIKQNGKEATYFDPVRLSDNLIDFEKESIETIYKKIRALSHPYKGAFLEKQGKKLIIWNAELIE